MTTKDDVDAVLGGAGAGSIQSANGWLSYLTRPWAVGAGVLLVAYLAWSALFSSSDAQWEYATDAVKRANLVVTVTATGSVEPTNQVEISSELSGTIASVEVDDNMSIQKGDVLARLDTDKLEATVDQARGTLLAQQAAIAEAEATVVELKQAFDRAETLMKRGAVTLEAFITAKAKHDRALASLSRSKADAQVSAANLRVAETNLGKACICSPITGMVLSRAVEPGQIVASSLQAPVLFTIAEDLRKMELRVDIDEADIGKVSVGNTASFTVEAYQDRAFPAEISELGFMPQTVDGVVTYEAVLTIDNSQLLLRPGMTATADIIVAEVENALTLPNAALRFAPPLDDAGDADDGRSGLIGLVMPRRPGSEASRRVSARADGRRTVWVLADGEAQAVDIRTGVSDGVRTEIVDGDLSEGALLITDMTAQ